MVVKTHPRVVGNLLCLLSAVGFGLMAVFAKLAYAEGVTVDVLLVARFGLAAVVLLLVSVASGSWRTLSRRTAVAGLAMGAFGYAAQAGLYLLAVSRVDASQVALVFCVYPVLVMAGAVATGREAVSVRRLVALALASSGIVLVLGGAASGGFDAAAALLSFGSAGVYATYILVGDRVVAGAAPVPLTALVCLGATLSCLGLSAVLGGSLASVGAVAWGWLGAIALVSTVAAVLLFFAGLARVGPSVASLLSTLEPVVTVVSAAVVFGEALAGAQVLGGVLVLAAAAAVQWPVHLSVAPRSSSTRGPLPQGPDGCGASSHLGLVPGPRSVS